MYWLILVGVLGQSADTPTPRTISRVRQSLNRFDDLDKVTLDAKSKVEADYCKSLPNTERRVKVKERVKGFASLELDVSPPYQDAELSMIENLVEDACKNFDVPKNQALAIPVRGWYNTTYGKVWGWQDQSTGYIHYYQQEQPSNPNCVGGKCYVR